MIDAWFYAGLVICLVAAGLCAGAALLKKGPNDITILATAAVELYLLVYLVACIVRLGSGESLTGAAWEFWGYLITALVLPVGGVYWALLERSRWSNLVLAVVALVVIVMLFRMQQLWYGLV